MNTRVITAIITVLCLAGVAAATIRRVSQNGVLDYATLQAAHDAAIAGDTVLVNPGRYGGFTLTKRLHIVGAGFDQTTISATVLFNTGSDRSTLSGVAISSYSSTNQIDIRVDSISINRCRLDSCSGG